MQPFQPEGGCFYFPICLLGEKHMIKMNLLYLQILRMNIRLFQVGTLPSYMLYNVYPFQITITKLHPKKINSFLLKYDACKLDPASFSGPVPFRRSCQTATDATKLPGASTSRSFPSFRFFVGGIGV